MADVLIDHVTKIYPGDVLAVDDVHVPIADGEFVVLVGPSGCGKSTTLRMVAGLEEITKGEISIGGRVVNDVPPKNRDIAMVFQNYALYPHMSVYKNMSFGLKLRKMPKPEIEKRIDNAAKILGIEDLLDRKPKALSGGQRQRVALGRAIVRDPACFLFDEPLSNLDAKLRVQTRAELKALHHRLKTTTIYVTHDQEEAMTLGDRVVVMANTKVQQAADPLTVYNAPVNRFVAGFVGTPPMNFIEGRLETGTSAATGIDGARFVGGGLNIALDAEKSSRVAGNIGQSVVLGLRPDGMHMRPTSEAPEHSNLEATIRVIEPLGGQMDMFCVVGEGAASGGSEFVARVKAEPIQAGSAHKLYVEPDKLHVFEPGEFGTNLTLDRAAAAV